MYVIENELGRFEADTERAAKALLRKAVKASQAKHAVDSENNDLARLRAQAVGYRILSRKANEGFACRGWSFHGRDDASFKAPVMRSSYDGVISEDMTYETEHGKATISHYRQQVLGIIENGSGWTMATILKSHDGGKVTVFAIGIAADQCILCDLPGIDMAFFTAEAAPTSCLR